MNNNNNHTMSEKNSKNSSYVLGGKTARACDSCVVKRARWFCAADDAFLCEACDASVHSANQLASRHQRVRLETASSCEAQPAASTWHQGFTRKARTPRRPPPKTTPFSATPPLVPEINNINTIDQEDENEELDQQLLYRVPVFDPDDHFCCGDDRILDDELNLEELLIGCGDCPRDEELAEFAETTLLGTDVTGVDREHGADEVSDGKRVKIEEEEENEEDDGGGDEVRAVIACHFDPALDMELNWDFEEGMMKTVASMNDNDNVEESGISDETRVVNNPSTMLLRLNYEAVIAAWATQQGSSSPWTDGIRPHDFNIDEFMVACLGGVSESWRGFGGRAVGMSDAEREARVSRYREKRRTRLFSKKIRYQVRKLNAEKRPRMKGRFVKRTTTTTTTTTTFSSSPSSFPNFLIHHK